MADSRDFFDGAEPATELGVGAPERLFGIDAQALGDIREDEEDIAKLILAVYAVLSVCEFLNLFDELVEGAFDIGPVEPDTPRPALDGLGGSQGGQ